MLKFLQNRDEVVDLVQHLSECDFLSEFKIGVAGSYVQGLNKKGSSIDIVLALKEGGNEDMIGNLDVNKFIHNFMEESYNNKINIIWLDLLQKDEEELIKYMASEGVEANPESAYTNIVAEVRWVDEDNDTSEDEDRISSSVVTFDEEDNEDDSDKEDE